MCAKPWSGSLGCPQVGLWGQGLTAGGQVWLGRGKRGELGWGHEGQGTSEVQPGAVNIRGSGGQCLPHPIVGHACKAGMWGYASWQQLTCLLSTCCVCSPAVASQSLLESPGWVHSDGHLTEGKTGFEGLSNLPKVAQLGLAAVWTTSGPSATGIIPHLVELGAFGVPSHLG